MSGHGTVTCYWSGCRCGACSRARNLWHAAYEYDRRHGRPRTVQAEPVMRHLNWLRDNGITIGAVAERTGVSEGNLYMLAKGTRRRVSVRTATAVMGTTIDDGYGRHFVSPEPTRELLGAMRATGITAHQIAAWLGYAHRDLPVARAHQKWVTYRTQKRVTTLYRLLVRQGVVPPLIEIEEATG